MEFGMTVDPLMETGSSNQGNQRNHLIFYLGMIAMIGSIFLRNVLDVPFPVLGILAIGVLIAVFGDQDEIFALVAACIPMSAAFQYKYLLIACIVIYVLKFGKDVKFTWALFPLALMMIWELLHGLGYSFSVYEYLRGFSELIFCTFLMMVMPKKINYSLICRTLAVASVCMMTVVLLNLLESTNYDFLAIFDGTYRFGVGDETVSNFGVNYNANGLGAIANLSIAGLLQLILAKKQRVLDYVLIVILALFGVLTMSRTFLLCFFLLILLFAVAEAPSFAAKVKRILGIVLLVAVLLFLVFQFMPSIVERFMQRFEVDDVTSGRGDLFIYYGKHVLSGFGSLFFGVGMQDYTGKINAIYDTQMLSSHNGILEILVCWGIPGLILFAWFVIEMIRSKKDFKKTLLNFIPFIILFVSVQAGQLISAGRDLLELSFVYMSLCWNPKEE